MSEQAPIGSALALRKFLESDQQARARMMVVAGGDQRVVDRTIAMACLAIAQSPPAVRQKLEACSHVSILQACMSAIECGLTLGDPVRSEAYLVPFGGVCKLMPGYRGLLKLARQSGEIGSVIAQAVCEGDVFWIDHAAVPPFSHRPMLDRSPSRERMLGVYCAVRWKNGHTEIHYMTRAEVDSVMEGVKKKNGGRLPEPWQFHYVSMALKTVVRRAMKLSPLTAAAERVVHESEGVEYEPVETHAAMPPGQELIAATERATGYAPEAEPKPEAAPRESTIADDIDAAMARAKPNREVV